MVSHIRLESLSTKKINTMKLDALGINMIMTSLIYQKLTLIFSSDLNKYGEVFFLIKYRRNKPFFFFEKII